MKVLLVHPGKQHSFETAKALKDAGVLYKYVTTVYDRPGSLTNRFKSLLKGKNLKKANTRSCQYLDDDEVVQFYEWWGLLVLLVSKIPFLQKLYFHLNLALSNHFADKAAKYAVRNNVDAIIVYDGISRKGLKYVKEYAPNITTIMDVSISMRPFMKANFEKDMKEYHHRGFYNEESYLWKEHYEKVIREELKYVDFFFAPSKIVEESLAYCGINKEKIYIVPYGVDVEKFEYVPKKTSKNEPLRLIYVGQISYRKGLHHLLNIVSQYDASQVKIILAGAYDKNSTIARQYQDKENIDFVGFVTRDVLAAQYQKSDLFVFPTLGEGYGMVVLEALSTGTPVLTSNLAGGNDAIEEGYNGMVYEALSEQALRESIDWFITNRAQIDFMSPNARKRAEELTWERYHSEYARHIFDILQTTK